MSRVLDWVPRFDERSRQHPVRELLPTVAPLQSKLWRCRAHLDQGQVPGCVGFGWAAELAAAPRTRKVDESFAMGIYELAEQLDDIPGEPGGSSVLAGAQAATQKGYLASYRWAFSIDDVLATLTHVGPVVLGTDWLDGMFTPGPGGVLAVEGSIAGGHCYLARGVRLLEGVEPLVRIRNSWGRSWGIDSDAYIRASDLERLLKGGEACVATDR